MDSVGAERAGLEKDLEEVTRELRRVQERLADGSFLTNAKPQLVEEQRALLNQLTSRHSRLQLNLENLEARRPGGLPATQSGTWMPLALHEWTRPPLPEEPLTSSYTPLGTVPVTRAGSSQKSPPELSRLIAQQVLSNESGKRAINHLRALVELTGTSSPPTLRLLAAAFDAQGRGDLARQLLIQVAKLTGIHEHGDDLIVTPPPIHPIAAMPAPELLPDARDGLSRAERVVLSTMHALWFRADGAPQRTALIVEELRLTDSPMTAENVEATLTRLTHPWSAVNPLVEVRGAVCRLTPLGEDLFRELDEGTVDFEPGFTFKMPRVLPARVPLLLAKGTDGIPPHSLSELLLACMHLLQFPGAPSGDLMECLSGPEFPMGGVNRYRSGGLYWNGRGTVGVSARVELQIDRTNASARCVVSQLPWPLELGEAHRRLVERKLEGVTSIRQEATCLIVELEHVVFASQVRRSLTTGSALTETFEVEFRFDKNGNASTGTLRDVLMLFLDHRRELVTRRFRNQLEKARARAEELEGLWVMLELLDPVMRVIDDASSAAERFWGLTQFASHELKSRVSFAGHEVIDPETLRSKVAALIAKLQQEAPTHPGTPSHDYALGFSERQARAILAIRKPTALKREALFRELSGFAAEMAGLRAMLESPRELDALIQQELAEQRERHAGDRRTELANG